MFRVDLYLVVALAIELNCYHVRAQDLSSSGTAKKETAVSPSSALAVRSDKNSDDSAAGTEKLLAPLAEDEQFFSAPDQKKTVQAAIKGPATNTKRQEVRLLGVGRVGQFETNETHAILKVDGKQLYKRIGDSFDDIEVVDIGRLSVTLQSGRERWTIELFKQPISNQSNETKGASTITRRNSPTQSSRSSVSSSAPKLVTVEPKLPSPEPPPVAPSDPLLEAPKLPDLELPPAPPDLPDFSNAR